jgi:glycosyltransferase involved in cell wall biosynthesis
VNVAYYSPLPPERSGIADYSALLVPALRERLDVVVVGPTRRRRRPQADIHLYHVGNNPEAHGWIVDELRRQPGVVVLHDFVLHHLIAGITVGRGNRDAYLDLMQAEAGLVGRSLAHAMIDGLLPPVWEEQPHEFPLASPVLDLASGLIVHSRYVEAKVRGEGYDRPIWRIPLAAWLAPPALDQPREDLQGSPLIACVGNLNPSKRVLQLLRAFAALRRTHPDARLLLAGAVAPGFELPSLGRDEGVVYLDYLDEGELWSALSAADISVSLRWPTMGETSAVALRALSLGRPLVVSDVGWFSELPDAVAAKVPVDEWEVDTLTKTLDLLASRPELREAMGREARAYVRREHALGRVADLYQAALEEAAGGEAVQTHVLERVSVAAHEVGYDAADPGISRVADALRVTGLGPSAP